MEPGVNAFIDVCALVTGLSNEEVAQTLLDDGLKFEAVVFCELGGDQRILVRGRPESLKLAHCSALYVGTREAVRVLRPGAHDGH